MPGEHVNEPSETMLKQKADLVNTNTINMNYEVRDPLYGLRTLTGQVTYTHQVINQPMGPIGFNRVSIQINHGCRVKQSSWYVTPQMAHKGWS